MTSQALRFAATAHDDQWRKFNDEAYINHPIRVARNVLKFKSTSNPELLMSAALLHDVVEDTGVALAEIASKFNFNVAAIVEELTSDDRAIAEQGKAEYLAQKMLGMSDYALTIKLCDRLDNTSDFDTAPEDFVERYSRETQTIIETLLENRDLTSTQLKLVQAIIKNVR